MSNVNYVYGFFAGENLPSYLPPFLLQIIFEEGKHGMNATSLFYTFMHRTLRKPISGTRKMGVNDPTVRARIAGVASYSEA